MHKWGGLRGVNLEVGSSNGLQPARYHTHDRLITQVHSLSRPCHRRHCRALPQIPAPLRSIRGSVCGSEFAQHPVPRIAFGAGADVALISS